MERDNSMTRRFLVDAGVAPGMRVMEIGCGGGEVTQVLAELVGVSGTVLGLDRDKDALAAAGRRMDELGLGNVRLMPADLAGDLEEMSRLEGELFDALVGRRVLMYLPDPAAVLRRLVGKLRSGALVVFEETDLTMVPARTVPRPALDRMAEWLRETLQAEGAHPAMGFDLPSTLTKAGLRFAGLRAEAVIEGQGQQFPPCDLLRLVGPRLIARGIASETEVDSLVSSLENERPEPDSVYVSGMNFCAWGRSGETPVEVKASEASANASKASGDVPRESA